MKFIYNSTKVILIYIIKAQRKFKNLKENKIKVLLFLKLNLNYKENKKIRNNLCHKKDINILLLNS